MAKRPSPSKTSLLANLTLSEDRTHLTMSGAEGVFTLSAEQVDGVVRTLTALRVAMMPPSPNEDPHPGTAALQAIRWQFDHQPATGQFQLALLAPALGWVGATMDPVSSAQLAKHIQSLLPPGLLN